MAVSAYKPWLRNLYVRRLFILFGMPFLFPAIVGYLIVTGLREVLPELIEAWQPEQIDEPS